LRHRKPHYRNDAPTAIKRIFKKHLTIAAGKLDAKTVVNVHDRLSREHPTMAARVVSYGSALYSWAIGRHKVDSNPFAGIKVAPTTKRDRVLTPVELKAVWEATAVPDSYNNIVRLLILTGARREEVAGMTWGELSPDLSIWTLPASRSKNSTAHRLPLPRQAREILARQARRDATQLVFAGRSDNQHGPWSGWGHRKLKLDRLCGVAGWTLHDLRRTCATGLQSVGARLETTENILGHVSGSRRGIVGVYQRHEFWSEQVRDLQRWADRVDAIVTGKVTDHDQGALDNVVSFSAAATA
jgi:integrase